MSDNFFDDDEREDEIEDVIEETDENDDREIVVEGMTKATTGFSGGIIGMTQVDDKLKSVYKLLETL